MYLISIGLILIVSFGVFNCKLYLIKQGDQIECFDENNTVEVHTDFSSKMHEDCKLMVFENDLIFQFNDSILGGAAYFNESLWRYVINNGPFQYNMGRMECEYFYITMCDKCDIQVEFNEQIYDINNKVYCLGRIYRLVQICIKFIEAIGSLNISTECTDKYIHRCSARNYICSYSPHKYCLDTLTSSRLYSTDAVAKSGNNSCSTRMENKCKQNCIICCDNKCYEYNAQLNWNWDYLYIILIPVVNILIGVILCCLRKISNKKKLDEEVYYTVCRTNEHDTDGHVTVSIIT